MRAKVATDTPQLMLERLLDALAQELVEATDEEILEAAADLGMNPWMKGSAAFFGLKSPFAVGVTDFFDILAALPEEHRQHLALPPGWKPKKTSDDD